MRPIDASGSDSGTLRVVGAAIQLASHSQRGQRGKRREMCWWLFAAKDDDDDDAHSAQHITTGKKKKTVSAGAE